MAFELTYSMLVAKYTLTTDIVGVFHDGNFFFARLVLGLYNGRVRKIESAKGSRSNNCIGNGNQRKYVVSAGYAF